MDSGRGIIDGNNNACDDVRQDVCSEKRSVSTDHTCFKNNKMQEVSSEGSSSTGGKLPGLE